MEDSAEKTSKLHGRSDRVTHQRFGSRIRDSLAQAIMAILRFFGYSKLDDSSSAMRSDDGRPHRLLMSSPEISSLRGTAADTQAQADGSVSPMLTRIGRVPPPRRSRGRDPQINDNDFGDSLPIQNLTTAS